MNRKQGDVNIILFIFGCLKRLKMGNMYHRCSKNVDGKNSVKNGKTKEGKQRFKCKDCGITFLNGYIYKACEPSTNKWVKNLLVEGSGIRSIGRLLEISPKTVLSRILKIAETITPPMIPFGKQYEVDELCTFIENKESKYWIAYGLRKDTREVVNFTVGKRTNKTLRPIINSLLLLSNAKTIFTDKLNNYKSLVPKDIHKTKKYCINHIERMNLNLRTHLKRLNRRTICFSRSMVMLSACLKIYFWG